MNGYRKCENVTDTRNRYVGASDIPTLFGLNKKHGQTWLTLWQEKKGLKKVEFDEAKTDIMNWGHIHEHAVIARYLTGSADLANKYLPNVFNDYGSFNDIDWERNTEFIHPEYSFIGCHPDLLLPKQKKIVECKSHSMMATKRFNKLEGYDFDDETGNGIPLRYRLQIQYQMLVCDVDECDFAVISDTNQYHEWRGIKANKKLQSKLLAVARRFWDYVEKNEPPPPQTMADIFELFPTPKQETAQVNEEISQEIEIMKSTYKHLSDKIKEIENQQSEIKNAIALFLGDAKYLNDFEGKKLATRVDTVRENFQLKEYRKDYPSEYEKLKSDGYIKISESRSVRI